VGREDTSTTVAAPVRSRWNNAPVIPPAMVIAPIESPKPGPGGPTMCLYSGRVRETAIPARAQKARLSYEPLLAARGKRPADHGGLGAVTRPAGFETREPTDGVSVIGWIYSSRSTEPGVERRALSLRDRACGFGYQVVPPRSYVGPSRLHRPLQTEDTSCLVRRASVQNTRSRAPDDRTGRVRPVVRTTCRPGHPSLPRNPSLDT
jgi:hypothetical protein